MGQVYNFNSASALAQEQLCRYQISLRSGPDRFSQSANNTLEEIIDNLERQLVLNKHYRAANTLRKSGSLFCDIECTPETIEFIESLLGNTVISVEKIPKHQNNKVPEKNWIQKLLSPITPKT